jgi:5-methylcytosine-specific restriction endonuclease McrBC regulatory subunit McrC
MIGTSYYHHLDDLRDGMEETSGGFVDLLAMLYGVHLQNSMSIGVPRAYVEEQMLGTTIRGTILTHRLVPGIWIHPHKIEQRVTEYVEDHLLNQFLRWGGEHLLRMASSPHAIDALESGLAYLSSVRAIPPPLSWVETFELSRVDDHVELLFGLAKLVYKMSGVALLDDNEAETTKSTEELVPSLVFSTWNVFENYCYSITRDAVSEIDQSLKVTYDARSKVTLAERVGDGRRLVHQPDIVVRSAEDGTIVPFVFDAKYSDRAFGRVPDRDARNQVLVAANDLQSPHAILMMPPYGGMDGERRRITWDLKSKEQWSTNTISVIYTNPLSESDPDAREKEVRWLAEELVAVQQT